MKGSNWQTKHVETSLCQMLFVSFVPVFITKKISENSCFLSQQVLFYHRVFFSD